MDGRAGPDPGRDRRRSSSTSCPGSRTSRSATAGRRSTSVEGHHYYWNFIYPNGVIAVDKLRAPVGQTTRLEVTAPDYDVIHSWWIPALGGKFDAIPARINETWFNAEAPGIYRGQCAELCGIQHALMTARGRGDAAARSSTLARASEAEAQEAGTSSLGAETFRGACAKCHGLAGEGDIGPRAGGQPAARRRRGGRAGRSATGGSHDAAGRQATGTSAR